MLRLYKNHRHTKILEEIGPWSKRALHKKTSISESFHKYIKEILPRYETQIETTLLRNFYQTLKNPELKRHLVNVYRRRKLNLVYKAIHPDMTVLPIRPAGLPDPPKLDYLGGNIANVRHGDIGRMYQYSLEEFQFLFPKVNFGHLHWVDKVMRFTFAFAFQMSPEAFSVIELLRKKDYLQAQPFESFRMTHLFRNAKSKADLEVLFSDSEIFLKIVNTIGDEFREVLLPLRFEPRFTALFGSSFLTDHIALVLAWSLDRTEVRELILDTPRRQEVLARIVSEIWNHPNAKYFLPYQIQSWIDNHQELTLSDQVSIKLTDFNHFVKKIPDALRTYMFPNFIGLNSNILLWGPCGAGKSGVLYAVTMWAIKSNWVVIKLPSAKALTFSWVENLIKHERSRLWMAPIMAEAVLQDIHNTNQDLLSRIPVNMDIYGFYDIVGVHQKEEAPVQNFYIEDRQTYFFETDKFKDAEEINRNLIEQQPFDVTLKDKLPQPATLMDIVQFGLKHPDYCTNAIAEILEQVYHLESHPTLVVVDDYNWFYRPTNNPSYIYQNLKTLDGFVPPYHVALARLFMKFDGHMIKRGFKVAGTSNFSISRHYFEPRKIHFPDEFCQEMGPMRVQDVSKFLAHFYENFFDTQKVRTEEYYKGLWMEAQGNPGRIVDLVKFPDFRGLDG
jgi:small subunit ribosomal protein S29